MIKIIQRHQQFDTARTTFYSPFIETMRISFILSPFSKYRESFVRSGKFAIGHVFWGEFTISARSLVGVRKLDALGPDLQKKSYDELRNNL